MSEQTEVDRATEAYNVADTNLRKAKLLAYQREHLLPKLEKRWQRLRAKLNPLELEEGALRSAMADIQAGIPTDYKLRQPRAKKPEGGA